MSRTTTRSSYYNTPLLLQVRSSVMQKVISIRSKYCFPYVHLCFETEMEVEEVCRLLETVMMKQDVSIQRAFAFAHSNGEVVNAGWNTYDPEGDFRRMGIPSMEWRFCNLNQAYERYRIPHTHTHSFSLSRRHSHALTITCTCCYDETKGTQDLKIHTHADAHILSHTHSRQTSRLFFSC